MPAGGLGGGQGIDDIDGAGEQGRVTLKAGGVGQGDGQVGLAHADPAEQDDVAVLGEEVQAEQLLDLGAVDLLRPAPVEAVEGLDAGQAGGLHAAAHQGLVAAGRLPGDQLFEKAAMGPGLACRLFGQGRRVLEDVVQLQPLQLLRAGPVQRRSWPSPSSPGIA